MSTKQANWPHLSCLNGFNVRQSSSKLLRLPYTENRNCQRCKKVKKSAQKIRSKEYDLVGTRQLDLADNHNYLIISSYPWKYLSEVSIQPEKVIFPRASHPICEYARWVQQISTSTSSESGSFRPIRERMLAIERRSWDTWGHQGDMVDKLLYQPLRMESSAWSREQKAVVRCISGQFGE